MEEGNTRMYQQILDSERGYDMEQWYDEIENISINWLSKRQNSILVYDSMLSLSQSGLIRGCVLFVELVLDFH